MKNAAANNNLVIGQSVCWNKNGTFKHKYDDDGLVIETLRRKMEPN